MADDEYYYELTQIGYIELRKFYCAILERAILDYFSRDPWVRHEAREWFLANEMRVFSYLYICEGLDLNAKLLWKNLVNKKEEEEHPVETPSRIDLKPENCLAVQRLYALA